MEDRSDSVNVMAGNLTGRVRNIGDAAVESVSYLNAIVESSHDAILSKDLDGLITSWNHGAELLYGYTQSEILGQSISVLWPEGHEDEIPEILRRVRLGKLVDVETIRRRRNGSLVEVSLTTSPILGSAGQVVGVSIMARDNSDRRKAEQLKDDFVALVSHELRTPLTSIIAHIDLLLDDSSIGAERSRRFLEVIDRNSARLERLVGDLLFVAEIDSTNLWLSMTDVDIVAVARDRIEAISARALPFDTEVTLSSVCESLILRGDPGRLGQALDNLISNAIKYSPDGADVAVRILTINRDCLIEIEDHGMGIATDDLDEVFDRFFRGSTSRNLHIQGIGLGLLIVKRIIEGHGGRVDVESEPGVGTTFRVVLPLPLEGHGDHVGMPTRYPVERVATAIRSS